MATKLLTGMKKKIQNRPGSRVVKSNRDAKIIALVFSAACVLVVCLQIFEIGTPGMAWYTYR